MPPIEKRKRKKKNKDLLENLPNDLPLHDVTESDVDGAIFCNVLATSMIDLKVDFDFPGHGTFTGTVTNFDAKESFGGAILHEVTFDDGEKDEYSYTKSCSHMSVLLKLDARSANPKNLLVSHQGPRTMFLPLSRMLPLHLHS